MGNVVISPNIKKESVRIDIDGNIIDPRTKRVIEKKEQPETQQKSQIEEEQEDE